MFDVQKRREWLDRGCCKRREYKKSSKRLYNYVNLMENVVPIHKNVLKELISLYNLYWVDKNLHCPKYNHDIIGTKAKSLLDNSDVYSISKAFISTEYERTKLKIIKDFMKDCGCFHKDLSKSAEQEELLKEKIRNRDKYYIKVNLEEKFDEEVNYL